MSSDQKKKKKFSFSAPRFDKKKMSSRKLLNLGLLSLGVLGFGYGAQEWKGFLMNRAFYVAKGAFRLNSSTDEFRMAVICHKLRKQNCKEMALAKAYNKDPKNVELNGEYAIALTDSEKHDQAILAFQKYFAQSEGTYRHKAKFAESLAQKEYFADAKEWYYKAIIANPENLEVAEAMMNMLTSAHLYGEALSVVGHFNMSIPRTQKLWHNLTVKIKTDFKAYQEKYAIKEMTISKLGNYFFAPGILNGALETQLFLVNPDSVYNTVDMNYLKSNGIPHEVKGNITVQAANGPSLNGTRVIIPSLMFGAWTLNNVEAVACDNCAFMAGKSILSQLNVQTTQVTDTRVNILSMKEK